MLVPAKPTPEFWARFVRQSPEQVSDLLAKEASLLRACATPAPPPQVKQADVSQWVRENMGKAIGERNAEGLARFVKDPRVLWGLAGAAGGGALGLASSLAQPKERRRPIFNTLLGALTGAGLGAAGGHFLGDVGATPGVDEQGRQAAPSSMVGGWYLRRDPQTGERKPVKIEERIPVDMAKEIQEDISAGRAGYFGLSPEQVQGLSDEQAAALLQERNSGWRGIGARLSEVPDSTLARVGGGVLAVSPVVEWLDANRRRTGSLAPEDLRGLQSKLTEYEKLRDQLVADQATLQGKYHDVKSTTRGTVDQLARQARELLDLENRMRQLTGSLQLESLNPAKSKEYIQELKERLQDVRKNYESLNQEVSKSPFREVVEELRARQQGGMQLNVDDLMRTLEQRTHIKPNDKLWELQRQYNAALDALGIESQKLNTPTHQRLQELFEANPRTGKSPADVMRENLAKIDKFQAGGETARGVEALRDQWRTVRSGIPKHMYGARGAAFLADLPLRAASWLAEQPGLSGLDIVPGWWRTSGMKNLAESTHRLGDRYFGQGYRSNPSFDGADPKVRLGKTRMAAGAGLMASPLYMPAVREWFFGNPFK